MKIPQATYSFETTILLSATQENAWNALVDFGRWKSWWSYVQTLTVDHDAFPQVFQATIGVSIEHLTFKATIIDIRPMTEFTFRSEIDLVGTGRFVVTQKTEGAMIVFYWNIATTKPWMNIAALLFRPLFHYSHNVAMKSFAKGLARHLGTRLLQYTSVNSHKK